MALQECFQQQYSKFGSTREQYFHVWRSFHYDENTDTIDSYIGRVKQVAALLNYGEPQVLELFKNTLPSRLYYMLYQIDDLRTAIEIAKRVFTKEKIDKQRTGQSSASPFMKASQENSKKNCEKGVSFGALETMERNSDNIDKLTSLVSKLDMKLDRKENQYRPRIYQDRNRGCGQRQDSYRSRDRSYSRDHSQYNNNRGRRNLIMIETIDPIIELAVGLEMVMEGMIDMIIDQTIEGTILDRIKEPKGIKIEV